MKLIFLFILFLSALINADPPLRTNQGYIISGYEDENTIISSNQNNQDESIVNQNRVVNIGNRGKKRASENDFQGDNEGDGGDEWLDAIPGEAGKDYPTLDVIPQTSFTCKGREGTGYYADVETNCQVFHVCQPGGQKNSFICPKGSIFNQRYFVCDWWYSFDCNSAEDLYTINSEANLVEETGYNNDQTSQNQRDQSGYSNDNSYDQVGYQNNHQDNQLGYTNNQHLNLGFDLNVAQSGGNDYPRKQSNKPQKDHSNHNQKSTQNNANNGDQKNFTNKKAEGGKKQESGDSNTSSKNEQITTNKKVGNQGRIINRNNNNRQSFDNKNSQVDQNHHSKLLYPSNNPEYFNNSNEKLDKNDETTKSSFQVGKVPLTNNDRYENLNPKIKKNINYQSNENAHPNGNGQSGYRSGSREEASVNGGIDYNNNYQRAEYSNSRAQNQTNDSKSLPNADSVQRYLPVT